MTLVKKSKKSDAQYDIGDGCLIKEPAYKKPKFDLNAIELESDRMSNDPSSSIDSSIQIIEENQKCCSENTSFGSSVQVIEDEHKYLNMNHSFSSSIQLAEINQYCNENIPAVKASCNTESEQQKNEKIYTVENVLKKQKRGNKIYYLIKWKGYSNKKNTWEPSENVEQLDLVKLFEKARKDPNYRNTSSKNLKLSYYDAVGDIWQVEEVVKKRIKNGEIEYFLKWKDADECYNSWEPRNKVKHTKVVKEFEKQEKVSLKAKEKNKMFHKMGIQACSQMNSELTYHRAKVTLPKLIEDASTRQFYDCITFRPITNTCNKVDNSWQKKLWDDKMIDKNFSKIQRMFCIMWNEFMTNNRSIFRGNCHMKPALDKFVEENRAKIKEHNLCAPYMSHVCIMKDLEILDQAEAMKYIMLIRY